ncbi:MAG TPA: AMP-binding protein [Paraburkholderia sp.]|uniref:class I adenylate-forming enzyme family protein n=1 Tax=Paraburkholderia sp. TaxID=1926495 RepID=UPI002ED6AA18
MRLADYFDAAATRSADHLAFIDGQTQLRFDEARQIVHATAHALRDNTSLPTGAHIAIYAPNDYRVTLLQLAVNRADMAWVAVHTRNIVQANATTLAYADCHLIFFHSSFEEALPELKAALPQVSCFVCIDKPSQHAVFLDDWIAPYLFERFDAAPEHDDAIALLQATGGTTGPSKAAVHTNRSLEMALVSTFDTLRVDQHSRVLAVAPLTHAAGLLSLAAAIRGGVSVVLSSFDMRTVLACIEQHRITHVFLPPTIVYMLLNEPDLADYDLSSLRCLAVGGAPIAPEKLKEAVRRIGPVVYEVFGQSECLLPLIVKRPEDYLHADGSFDEAALRSAGRGVPYARVEIMDEEGNLVAPGEKGEIVVRSTMVMQGYYKLPEETAQVSTFGWHHTTDVGIQDERGFITIVDRKKDMIVSGGFNLFPAEIEAVLNSHPAVLDCAVIGVPDEKWGEAVKAVVQLKPGQVVEADELVALCKQHLGGMKTPKSVEFWPQLPRSAVGKLLKREIRAKYWDGNWRQV